MSQVHTVVDPELVRAELARVVGSPDFVASDRNRRFLAYVVEETLGGRSSRIKAYTIATSVFGRDGSFDSQLDSIVRIEAGRLRRSLDLYYLTAGVQDDVRIVIPRGTYVPNFVSGEAAPVPRRETRHETGARDAKPIILVLDVVDESVEPSPFLASGLTRQIVVGLTRFSQFNVFGQQTIQALNAKGDLAHIRTELDIDFFVTGGLSNAAGRLHVDGLLIDAHTGRYLWAETYDRPCAPTELLGIRDEIASNVVRTLAQPWGVIHSRVAAEARDKQPDDMTSFDAIVRFHDYAAAFDPVLYPPARAALERAVAIDPDFGDAWACLSRLQLEGARFGFRMAGDPAPGVMVKHAVENARRAVGLAPSSSQSFLALGLAYWFSGDVEAGLEALATAIAMNPNDTEAMAELGLRQCLRQSWDEGVPRLVAAYELNPALPPNHRMGLGLWHFVHGRMREAHEVAVRLSANGVMYRHLLIAVTAQALGNVDEARAAVNAMLEIDPDYGCRIEEDLARRNVHPELIARLVDGLRLAGMGARIRPAVGME